jgi:phosphodiesterase/alkaline phosphatase D-like protein
MFSVALLRASALGQDALIATEMLGRPTDHSVTVNAVAGYDAEAFVRFGTTSGVYPSSTDTIVVPAGSPIELVVDSLQPNTRYYYRLCYRRSGSPGFITRDEHSFHTRRARGSTFRFTVEADPHLYDKKGSSTLMQIALQNQLNDGGDFLFDLGDTFGDDHHPDTISSATVWQLHLNYRPFFGAICHSVPLFLCLGNHEGENGFYLNEDPPNNLGVYGTLSRQFYYPNPVPDDFYSGNSVTEDYGMGLPENYYAFEWGDALFVVLDVYRHYTTSAKPNGWDWTIGDEQYAWLKQTLESSTAPYKFVFAHHTRGQGRGGAATAGFFEWGGYEADGTTWGFGTHRPGWAMPIHQLMVANGVNIFFQGHDHLFAKEELDGIVYQEVPMPCDSTYVIGMENADAYIGDTLHPSGHMRVTVAPTGVLVQYVKAVEPWDETPEHPNGEIAYSYTIGENPTSYVLTVIQSGAGVVSPGTTLVDSGATQRFAFTPSSAYHVDSVFVDGLSVPDSTEGYTFVHVVAHHLLRVVFAADSAAVVDTLLATELLGRPTDQSATLHIVPGYDMMAFVEYGTAPGIYAARTDTVTQIAGRPLEVLVDGLAPDTRYYYRLRYRLMTGSEWTTRAVHSFHTQRNPGSTFVFDVQADPHIGNPASPSRDAHADTMLYRTTLRNELADNPDFLLDLGDSFMNEKYYGSSYEATRQAYFAHLPFFGITGHSVPLFLINGNHEGELGWKLNGAAENLALWSVRARNLYYPNPVPGEFYAGSSTPDPNLLLDTGIVNKKRDGYYAWNWGNALFIVLDPFWYTTAKPTSYTANPDEGWKWTLGESQYTWLRQTLEQNTAPFTFVFIHNLLGGNSKDARGGMEAARYYEWGGEDITGLYEWDAHRTWAAGPVHDLLAAQGVSIVFHGHDHFFCRQQLDGVIYQECAQASNANYSDTPSGAGEYGYLDGDLLGNSGHLRITVSDSAARVEYVRAYRPEDETPTGHNGDVGFVYTLVPRLVAPALLFPDDGAADVQPDPVLRWQPLPNAQHYEVQVAADSTFSTILVRDSSVTVDRRTISGLQAAATYYWRVRAHNAGGTGPWSTFRRFTTATALAGRYVFDAQWNLVSVPLGMTDFRRSSVFPEATSSAYAFTPGTGYLLQDTLRNGVGFWLKFASSDTVDIAGNHRTQDTVAVVPGWNLIGSLSVPVDTGSVKTSPPGILGGVFYAYRGSYVAADTLYPARGYWVKALEPGILVLSPTPGRTMRAPLHRKP